MYMSLWVNISSQHYAGFSGPYAWDREGREVQQEHDHLQQLAVSLDLIQPLPI